MSKERKEARKKKGYRIQGTGNSKLSPITCNLSPILSWYRKNKRDLPWRKTNDPYKIWISEIMLQQTQVKTVIDYYDRFLNRLPTIADLANAKEEEVFALWSGLGYYSRARNLHQAAKKIMNEHERKFPTDPDKILSLPGIGKYTLGAIASIAFQKPLPLVDGNVIRVYSRFFALPGNPQDLKFQKKIWDLADEFLDRKNPGDFNQALMELGATICTPMSPSCLLCPIQKECRGKLNPEKFPQKKEKQKTKKLSRLVALLIEKNKICLVLPENNRWQKGLWQLPGILTEKKEDLEKEMKEFLEKEKIPSDSLTLLPSHKHHITHHKITIYPYLTKLNVIPKIREKSRWVSHSELKDIAIPAADRKIIESLKLSS